MSIDYDTSEMVQEMVTLNNLQNLHKLGTPSEEVVWCFRHLQPRFDKNRIRFTKSLHKICYNLLWKSVPFQDGYAKTYGNERANIQHYQRQI